MGQFSDISLSWADYTIFILTICLSGFVGLYYGIYKNKPKTMEEYMFGGRNMPLIPILLSNMASSISCIAIVALPRETYYYGSQMWFTTAGEITMIILMNILYLPLFYKLKYNSMFEYLERRFNKFTRSLGSAINSLTQIFLLLVNIYTAGSAITQVIPIPFQVFTPAACLLCTVYTALGGLRGVVWVDSLQAVVMLASVVLFIGFGIYDVGGIGRVIEIYNEGGRNNIDVFELNPFVRYSPITTWISAIFIACITSGGINQGLMQRYLSLSSYEKARLVAILSGIGNSFLLCLPVFFGVVIYATYYNCDPVLSQSLTDNNQLVTYYILEKGKVFPGLSGLLLAAIVSAAFSTMSTIMNSVSALIYEDLIKPFMRKELTASQTNLILKSLVAMIGLIISFGTLGLSATGSIYQLFRTMLSLVSSSLIFIFTYGMFYRKANAKGAIIGGIAGLLVTVWLGLGIEVAIESGQVKYNTKVVSIEGCPGNMTENLNITTIGYRDYVPVDYAEDLSYAYRISFNLISFIGFVVSFIVGLLVSQFTSSREVEDEHLLVPFLRKNKENNIDICKELKPLNCPEIRNMP